MSKDIHDLISEVEEAGSSSRTSKYRLDEAGEQLLDEFVAWLKANGKTDATASSYRSYCAKAAALGQSWGDMTSDQRSAVRKLAEFVG